MASSREVGKPVFETPLCKGRAFSLLLHLVSSAKEQFAAKDFVVITTSFAVFGTNDIVQRLGCSVGVLASVTEIVQYLALPILRSPNQGIPNFSLIFRDVCSPSAEHISCSLAVSCFIPNGIEALLGSVSRIQNREVSQPSADLQNILRRKLRFAFEKEFSVIFKDSVSVKVLQKNL